MRVVGGEEYDEGKRRRRGEASFGMTHGGDGQAVKR